MYPSPATYKNLLNNTNYNRTRINNISLKLPSILDVGSFENEMNDFFKGQENISNIELDLSSCVFIEITALIAMIALITRRARQGLQTSLALPTSKDVRDFMRIWNFPLALEYAVGRPFRNIVRKEDHNYFGENKSTKDMKYSGIILSKGVERLLSKRFFSIYTFSFKDALKLKTIDDESKRWEGKLIGSVLSYHLGSPEGYIPSRVIYECMSNAARHPRAMFVQTASHFDATLSSSFTLNEFKSPTALRSLCHAINADHYALDLDAKNNTIDKLNKLIKVPGFYNEVRRKKGDIQFSQAINNLAEKTHKCRLKNNFSDMNYDERNKIKILNRLILEFIYPNETPKSKNGQNVKSAFLTIVFWDDGISMIDTLRSAISNNKDVRSEEFPEKYSKIRLKFQNGNSKPVEQIISSDYLPDNHTEDYILFIATTFPGITCDAKGEGYSAHRDLSAELKHPGMGLFTLINTVIDIFGGSVAFRSKNYFMNIKSASKSDKGVKYKAKIFKLSNLSFLGNMLTVRLPLNK